MCRSCATYCWKAFNEGYNFALNLTSIQGLHKKNMGLQSYRSPNFENFGTINLGIPEQNDIWGWPGG